MVREVDNRWSYLPLYSVLHEFSKSFCSWFIQTEWSTSQSFVSRPRPDEVNLSVSAKIETIPMTRATTVRTIMTFAARKYNPRRKPTSGMSAALGYKCRGSRYIHTSHMQELHPQWGDKAHAVWRSVLLTLCVFTYSVMKYNSFSEIRWEL